VTAQDCVTVHEIVRDGNFRIESSAGDFTARAVINAAGRWSNLAPELKAAHLKASVGLKRHYSENNPSPSVDLYFFSGGYCGVQPVGENEVNVSAMVLPSVAKSLEEVFPHSPQLLERSRGWIAMTDSVSTYPLVHRKPAPLDSERNILNVGDAAGFIDPFVGDGISMALHTGEMAAESLHGFLSGDCSLREATSHYEARYTRSLLPAFRNAARLRRLICSPIARGLALQLFRLPLVPELALKSTRARIA